MVKESGVYFDNKFLLNIINGNSLTLLEAKYLLEKKNYNFKTIREFHKAFIDFRMKNITIIKKMRTFLMAKARKDNIFSIDIGCYCVGERKGKNI